MIHRRTLISGLGAGTALGLAAPHVVRAQAPVTIKVGSLKLIHSIAPHFYERFTPESIRVEVVPFESPTEGKNAVITKSVDFGTFGIAAAMLGAAAGEPLVLVATTCNRGAAIIPKKGGGIEAVRDVRGKRVAIWLGSPDRASWNIASSISRWLLPGRPRAGRCGGSKSPTTSHSQSCNS